MFLRDSIVPTQSWWFGSLVTNHHYGLRQWYPLHDWGGFAFVPLFQLLEDKGVCKKLRDLLDAMVE